MRARYRPQLPLVLLFLAFGIQLAGAWIGSFRADDWWNLERSQLLWTSRWPEIWTRLDPLASVYRPIVFCFHAILLRLFGLTAPPQLTALVLFFALQTWLLSRLVRERGGRREAAWLVALAAWMQFTDYTWTTLWASNATGSLMTTFLLATFVLHHRYVRLAGGRGQAASSARGLSRLGLTAIAAAGALMCKEEALLMPVELAWLEILRWRKLDSAQRHAAAGSWLVIAALTAVYAGLRLTLLQSHVGEGSAYRLHFGMHSLHNLQLFAVHLCALPVVAALLTRVLYPAAWRARARRGPEWESAREALLGGFGWALIGIQLYLLIGHFGYAYLHMPALGIAFAVGQWLSWAAGVQGAEAGHRRDPALVLAVHGVLALASTVVALATLAWPLYGPLTRQAFAELDRTLPNPPDSAVVAIVAPWNDETPARSVINRILGRCPGSALRLHYGRTDVRACLIEGADAQRAWIHPPAVTAVYLARRGRLSLLARSQGGRSSLPEGLVPQ